MADPAKWTGTFGATCENIRSLVAATAYFQSWTGTANATAALARVYDHVVLASASTFPYAVVLHGENLRQERIAQGQVFSVWPTGMYHVRFVDEIGDDYVGDPSGGMRKFRNDVCGATDASVANSYNGVITQMMALVDNGGYLDALSAIAPGQIEYSPRDLNAHDKDIFEWTWNLEMSGS